LEKKENPLSEEELHFIRRCCQILKIEEKQKVKSIDAAARRKGMGRFEDVERHPEVTRSIRKEAEAHRRDSPAPFLTIGNAGNLDAPAHSLQ
jgi:hypothetical protein